MIIYDLRCDNQHAFEGWFSDPQDYVAQLENGAIACPVCNSLSVRRVPSAVAISTGGGANVPRTEGIRPAESLSATHFIAAFRQFSQAVLSKADDVGSAFAETARRMHYEEIPERPIRGQASDAEYEALEDEGIPVMKVPVFREEDLN